MQTFSDTTLDDQIEAAAQAQFQARSRYAELLEERLRARLRAVLPDGGVLRIEHWTEGLDFGVTLMQIDPPGTPLSAWLPTDTSVEELLGSEHEAVTGDVEALQSTGVSGLHWRYGDLNFTF